MMAPLGMRIFFPASRATSTRCSRNSSSARAPPGEDDDVPSRPENRLAVYPDGVDRGGLYDDREVFPHKGVEVRVWPGMAERRQFLRPPGGEDIEDGGDPDALGVCGDDMPDVAASQQPYFNHRIKKL